MAEIVSWHLTAGQVESASFQEPQRLSSLTSSVLLSILLSIQLSLPPLLSQTSLLLYHRRELLLYSTPLRGNFTSSTQPLLSLSREDLAAGATAKPHQMRRAWANLTHHPDSSTSHRHNDAAPPYSSHSNHTYDQRPDSDSAANKSSKSTKSSGKSHRSKTSINSLKSRAGTGQSGMLDSQRRDNRRERTFVGTECAVCEEPLEHTLRGERILQFSCGHVSHGACFYEYLKMGGEPERHHGEGGHCPSCERPLGLDTSRGGNVLDIGKSPYLTRRTRRTTERGENMANRKLCLWIGDGRHRRKKQKRGEDES